MKNLPNSGPPSCVRPSPPGPIHCCVGPAAATRELKAVWTAAASRHVQKSKMHIHATIAAAAGGVLLSRRLLLPLLAKQANTAAGTGMRSVCESVFCPFEVRTTVYVYKGPRINPFISRPMYAYRRVRTQNYIAYR